MKTRWKVIMAAVVWTVLSCFGGGIVSAGYYGEEVKEASVSTVSTSATIAKDGYTLVKNSGNSYTLTLDGFQGTKPLTFGKSFHDATINLVLKGNNTLTINQPTGNESIYNYQMDLVTAIDGKYVDIIVSGNGSLVIHTDGIANPENVGVNQAFCCRSLTMKSGTLEIYAGSAVFNSAALVTYGTDTSGGVMVTGGKLTAKAGSGVLASPKKDGNASYSSYACGIDSGVTTITGGSVWAGADGKDNTSGINSNGGSLRMTGGSLTLKCAEQPRSIYHCNGTSGGNIELSGNATVETESGTGILASELTIRENASVKSQGTVCAYNSILVKDKAQLDIRAEETGLLMAQYGDGSLTVAGGKVNIVVSMPDSTYCAYGIQSYAPVNINGGTVTVKNADIGIQMYDSDGKGDLTIRGGTLYTEGKTYGIYKQDAAIQVMDGSLTAVGDIHSHSSGIEGTHCRVLVSGGSLKATGSQNGIYLNGSKGSSVDVTGGSLTAAGSQYDVYAWSISNAGKFDANKLYQKSTGASVAVSELPKTIEKVDTQLSGVEDGFTWTYTYADGHLLIYDTNGVHEPIDQVTNKIEAQGYSIRTYVYSGEEYNYPGKGEKLPETGVYKGSYEGFDWKYEASSKTLSINGKGEMPSFFGVQTELTQYVVGTENLVIGDAVTALPDYLFTLVNSQLKDLKIGKSFSKMSPYLTNVKGTIVVDSSNESFTTYDHVLYTQNYKELLLCPQGKTSISFPKGLQIIGSRVLDGLRVKELVIPWGVTTLKNSAFTYVYADKVILPDTIHSIDEKTFALGKDNYVHFIFSKNNTYLCRETEEIRNERGSNIEMVDSVASYYSEASTVQNGLIYQAGKAYYYENGVMQKSKWVYADGNWYYLNDYGAGVVNCWRLNGGKYYYLGADGKMKTNSWVKDYGNWYYVKADGSRYESSWAKIGGAWYWFGGSGKMAENQWLKLADGKWYYFTTSGAMAANRWVKSGSYWYYLGKDGAMLTNTTTPDGYKVDAAGRWI